MTKFNALQIKFDEDYLNKLTEDPNSGVFKQNCKYHIALHPAQFTDFGQSVKDELGRKIARYDDIFQGIMLGYQNIKLQSSLGVIGIENCYVHFDIQADFFIFRPEIGMILKGVVTRTTKDHVGCLVYGTFNISLPKPEHDAENWLGNKATMQSDVVFRIIFVDLNARLPFIKGEVISVSNEGKSIKSLSEKKSKKVNKKIKFENDIEEEDMSPILNKKHKKKHNKNDESMEFLEINGGDVEDVDRAKKRRTSKLKDGNDNDSTAKHKKRQVISNSEDNASFENLEIKLEQSDEELNDVTPNLKKKHKKDHNKVDETLKIFEVKEKNLWDEEVNTEKKKHKKKKREISEYTDEIHKNKEKRKKEKQKQHKEDLSLESLDIKSLFDSNYVSFESNQTQDQNMTDTDTTLKSTEERTKNHNKNGLQFEESEIKMGDHGEDEITRKSKKHKKGKRQNLDPDDKKMIKEQRREKKRKREQDEADVSLGSLDIKFLFENGGDMEDVDIPTKRRTSKQDGNENDSTAKPKKRQEISNSKDNASFENLELKEEVKDGIKLEVDDVTPNSKKKHKKDHNKVDDTLKNLEIKEENLWEEEVNTEKKKHKKNKSEISKYVDEVHKKKEKRKKEKQKQQKEDLSLESLDIKSLFDSVSFELNQTQDQIMRNTTPKSNEKRTKNCNKNGLLLGESKIKMEDLGEDEINRNSHKHKKEKIQNLDSDDKDKKKEQRREKKKKREQDEADVSLGSLDLKSLFEDSSLNLNTLHRQGMANDADRGKRRKSISISQEIYLEKVKLEEDSDLEKIISEKRRKRSKSVST